MGKGLVAVLAGVSWLASASVLADAGNQNTGREAAPTQQQTQAYSHWQLYNRAGQPVTGQQIAKARAVEMAVEKANAPEDSKEAALIRMGMGQSPEIAYQRNDAVFDEDGRQLNDDEVAEYLAIQEAMARGGVAPGSEQEAEIVAAAKGERKTEDGEPVAQKTYEDMAKEIAVQEAIMRSGAQPGSANEAMIRTGADVLMERMKSW
ncbi:hypothetical protein IMCC21906_00570 [Spongiibacter sp. IMCC21906]|jgi:hypothetical protein|uniref:hypothetical protein n=1 Tax=Spongiibacter sp. IMCC21906 TaxID=1620392 RepID=UPI00062DF319|nr:hypothetical protein [Spongiibacter sp. IMCC21906]AKH68263.1 hypothetical protein IMCC21906_00570 [Spongiibacter sp. IMCC21906]